VTLITGNGPQIEFHPPRAIHIPKYSPAAPTHNGIRPCAGPSLLYVRRTVWHPIPRQRCCCHSWAGCTAPHPPTRRPYGLLPNMSESSGTPGENLARGSFSWPAHEKKPRQPGRGNADRHWSGRARESPGPWYCLLLVGARLFPDFNPPRSAPATADKPNAQASP
jgi:hypothetical protein